MKPIFDTCVPRPEVLAGELNDETFAARLRDVVEGVADPVYQDPAAFFRNTFPTDGLRTLARESLGRLSGREPSNSPFIRLETSFGGGKTHNLIALYHLATGGGRAAPGATDGKPTMAGGYIVPGPDWLPADSWRVAGVVGSDLDPTEGLDRSSVRTRTLWGELAWQLGRSGGGTRGGRDAYEHVRKSDEAMLAPGTQALERMVGDGPALIMLDEIARHLRTAKAVATANGRSDLAEQTVAFLMSLIEMAAGRKNVVVVLTLADSLLDAFGDETELLQKELREARKLSARHERVITPAQETEIARIVRHRLFESCEASAATETADAYQHHYRKIAERDADIPERLLDANFREEMTGNYPFHPELFTVLSLKTATIPHFQKTRGALRLLVRMVRRLWRERPADTWTIAPHHIDLGDEGILNDLTSRLNRPEFRQVVEADIASRRAGASAHAEKLDKRWLTEGKPPYGRRLATSIFVHSLTRGIAAGVELPDLIAATIQPGDDPHLIRRTLSRARGEDGGAAGEAFWFLHWDGRLLLFKTEPSLEKVVEDELALVGTVRAKQEADRRIQGVWRPGTFAPVPFPAEAAELPDDSGPPKLAVPHYDACYVESGRSGRPEPPDLVRKLFARAGTAEAPRAFKNNILFLVADKDGAKRMVDLCQRHLAIRRIVGDRGRLAQFSGEQRKRLREMDDAAGLKVRVAITRAYRHLFYPSADAPRRSDGLAYHSLPAQEQGKVSGDQTSALVNSLRHLEKVLTGDDKALSAQYVKAKAWIRGRARMSTEDLRKEFGKRLGLRIPLDPNQLKRTIRNGCAQGVWVYHGSKHDRHYGKDSPAPLVQISDDVMLYTPDEARRVFPEQPDDSEEAASDGDACPLCVATPCDCGDGSDAGADSRLVVTENGAPGRVFQRIADAFGDARSERVERLVIRTENLPDMKALGLALPQLPNGDYRLTMELTAEFGDGDYRESLEVRFAGGRSRYRRMRQILEAQAGEADATTVQQELTATYPAGIRPDSSAFRAIRDVMVQLDMGRIEVEATSLEQVDRKPPPQ